jgi:5-methylcytosine-specific restriction endonuclease McrA
METQEQKRERWKRWYANAKQDPAWVAKRKVAKRESYERDQSVVLARNRAWAIANPDKVKAIARRFYLAHIEDERRRSLTKDPEKRRAAVRRWAKANPMRRAAVEGKRRARKRESFIGPVDYAAVVSAANGICALCGEAVANEPAHIDHVTPLAVGGSHTQDNLQFTHARCNLAKGAKLLSKVG